MKEAKKKIIKRKKRKGLMDAGAFNRARSAQVDGFIRRRDAISPAAALDSDAGRFSAACRRRLQSAVDCLTRRDWLREARGGGVAQLWMNCGISSTSFSTHIIEFVIIIIIIIIFQE